MAVFHSCVTISVASPHCAVCFLNQSSLLFQAGACPGLPFHPRSVESEEKACRVLAFVFKRHFRYTKMAQSPMHPLLSFLKRQHFYNLIHSYKESAMVSEKLCTGLHTIDGVCIHSRSEIIVTLQRTESTLLLVWFQRMEPGKGEV